MATTKDMQETRPAAVMAMTRALMPGMAQVPERVQTQEQKHTRKPTGRVRTKRHDAFLKST